MANKFHVSADGVPHQCFASIRPCPLGGPNEHYPSQEEARTAFEASMASDTFKPLSKGYTVTALVQTGEARMPNGSGAPHQQLPLRGGFETPSEAVEWAKTHVREATSLVNLTNEEWDGQGPQQASGNPMETGKFKSLSLIDISEDKEAFETKDVPTIGKFLIKKYGDSIKDDESLKLFTRQASAYVDQKTLSRVRAYVRAGTFGQKKDPKWDQWGGTSQRFGVEGEHEEQ